MVRSPPRRCCCQPHTHPAHTPAVPPCRRRCLHASRPPPPRARSPDHHAVARMELQQQHESSERHGDKQQPVGHGVKGLVLLRPRGGVRGLGGGGSGGGGVGDWVRCTPCALPRLVPHPPHTPAHHVGAHKEGHGREGHPQHPLQRGRSDSTGGGGVEGASVRCSACAAPPPPPSPPAPPGGGPTHTCLAGLRRKVDHQAQQIHQPCQHEHGVGGGVLPVVAVRLGKATSQRGAGGAVERAAAGGAEGWVGGGGGGREGGRGEWEGEGSAVPHPLPPNRPLVQALTLRSRPPPPPGSPAAPLTGRRRGPSTARWRWRGGAAAA